ncbi:hypothetical protein B0H16DRAFT_1753198 [Mycena metata]|uniref:CxC2-like cysteine cluster KDZ transposase-associated domain-containing protein n=1 Tax=Mycena metata TaxID=1033252 RepID=A0AAD7DC29_9AGAR|nr:hypothetical protein B0H16DRAFT_1753198 [Mycena metata]
MSRRDSDIHYDDDFGIGDVFSADRGLHVSNDGARLSSQYDNIRAPKKRRRGLEDLTDDYGTWMPVPDHDLHAVHAVADTVTSYDVFSEEVDSEKRKRFPSSDPMAVWKPMAEKFLDALLRRDGLGDFVFSPACSFCQTPLGSTRMFRCTQCGEFLQCEKCLLSRHALTPLHAVQEWNGEHWIAASLSGDEGSLGLVFQIGHHGFPCDFPGEERKMVVLDLSGVHKIAYRYCQCEANYTTANGTLGQLIGNAWYPASTVDPHTCATLDTLDTFRLLNVVGNVNVQDFVGTLERKTDPLRVGEVPYRYKEFGYMARQYNFELCAKRTGCGRTENGVTKAKPGAFTVPCWPCPHDNRNLPEGWRDVDSKYKFLYMLLLAMDANFRLKNRLRANEHDDPALRAGNGYFVEDTGYKKHLRNYVAEKDASTCIAFAALLQKETRMTSGLRCSGVGGCVCARHGVIRSQGLGDLQKGERYANMDYILLSALLGITLVALTISYDIACQWKINLATRAAKIEKDADLSTRLEDFEIQFALPVWHAAAHEVTCQMENSLSYTAGVGRTDGEGIERTWAILNPLGFSTKEMGAGARHDVLENKVDHINWEKNIGQGDTLARKLIVAIAERDKQVAEFVEIDQSLGKRMRAKWQKKVDDWRADRSQANPYVLAGGKAAGPSEAAVLLELKAAEALEAAEGRTVIADAKATAPAFIKAGLQLEEAQRRIRAEVKGVTLVTADRSSQIQEMRNSFVKKLRTYERLQESFMPGVAALKAEAEEGRDPDRPAPKVEEMKLWLPSEMKAEVRRRVCRKGVAEVEGKVRAAQCTDALNDLRSRLHAQKHLITWRNSNSTGQRAATRSATLIGRVGDRISRVADKYRRAREALIELKGPTFAPEFKALEAKDLSTNLEEENDADSRRKLARLGSSKRARNEPTSGTKTFSWLWTAGGGPGENEEQLHESVRVEWSKAQARKERWVEEVQLLREEMKRVLRMLRTIQGEWAERAEKRKDIDLPLAAGLKAYALRQIYVHRRIAQTFYAGWSVSVAAAVQQVVARDGGVYLELLDGEGLDNAPTLSPPRATAGGTRIRGDEGGAPSLRVTRATAGRGEGTSRVHRD